MKRFILSTLILGMAAAACAGTGPTIQFKDVIVDFGTVSCGEIVSCDFTFTSTGDDTLVLSDVQPGCGCTTTGSWTKTAAPGQTGVIPVRFDSSHFSGPVSKAIIVESNAKNNARLCLILKGTIFRAFDINPLTALLVLHPGQTSAAAQVRITRNGTNSLDVFDPVVSSTRGNSYKVELATNAPGSEYILTVSTGNSIKSDIDCGSITLRTTATNVQGLRVPLVFSSVPWFSICPSPLVLPKNPTKEVSALITIVNDASYPVALFNPKASDTNLAVALAATNPGHTYTLNVAAPSGYALSAPARITAETSNTNQPLIVIQIEQK